MNTKSQTVSECNLVAVGDRDAAWATDGAQRQENSRTCAGQAARDRRFLLRTVDRLLSERNQLRERVAELEERDDPHAVHLLHEQAESTEALAAAHARVAELEGIFARVHEVAKGYGFEAPADVTHEAAVLLLLHGHKMDAYNQKRIAELEAKLATKDACCEALIAQRDHAQKQIEYAALEWTRDKPLPGAYLVRGVHHDHGEMRPVEPTPVLVTRAGLVASPGRSTLTSLESLRFHDAEWYGPITARDIKAGG